jgi:hypothetical protein
LRPAGPGSHPVTEDYSGDAAYQASTSAALTQQVAYKVRLLSNRPARQQRAPYTI